MVAPPILEIFIVWHPDDNLGPQVYEWILQHFHGAAYAGLAGGAVSVYGRSLGWDTPAGPPRPLPFMHPLPGGLQPAQITAVVPVLGRAMALAIRDDQQWKTYMEQVFAADIDTNIQDAVFICPLRDPLANLSGSALAEISRRQQGLPFANGTSAASLARELAQAIAQHLHGPANDRITVFLSHTKHAISARDTGPRLVESVRDVLQRTHLDAFFDAHDIQSGDNWEKVLDDQAGRQALLMIRTDRYASREWTQREVLVAKERDLPIVALYAVRDQEERGSFLMDHIPVVACPEADPEAAIEHALNRLVDEALKRALWQAQGIYLKEYGFDWLPVHAPEPVTLTAWLRDYKSAGGTDDPHIFIMHPDPPLGPRERSVIIDICQLSGFTDRVDILTPRTFASRGGVIEG